MSPSGGRGSCAWHRCCMRRWVISSASSVEGPEAERKSALIGGEECAEIASAPVAGARENSARVA